MRHLHQCTSFKFLKSILWPNDSPTLNLIWSQLLLFLDWTLYTTSQSRRHSQHQPSSPTRHSPCQTCLVVLIPPDSSIKDLESNSPAGPSFFNLVGWALSLVYVYWAPLPSCLLRGVVTMRMAVILMLKWQTLFAGTLFILWMSWSDGLMFSIGIRQLSRKRKCPPVYSEHIADVTPENELETLRKTLFCMAQ